MIYTTLNKIREQGPCSNGWKKLLDHLGKNQADDEQLPLLTILESNGLNDALWCLRACDGIEKEARLYAVACARRVQHLMKDQQSIDALDVAERYAYGNATNKEFDSACAAACWRGGARRMSGGATWMPSGMATCASSSALTWARAALTSRSCPTSST